MNHRFFPRFNLRSLTTPLVCFCLATASLEAAFDHPGLQHTAPQLDRAQHSAAIAQVVALADKFLNEPSDAVYTFEVPGYFQDPSGQQTKVRQFQTDVRAAYTCALAFQLTGKAAYASAAKRLVLSWVDKNRVVRGYDGPIVMTYLGVGFLIAADMTWDAFTSAEIARLRTWSHEVFFLQAANIEQTKHENNHRTWGIYASLAVAFIRHDAELFAQEVSKWKSHVSATIAYDGRMPLELSRGSNAGWYTYFALAPMLASAQTIQNVTGEQLWDYNQRAMERALTYLYTNYANPDRLGAGSSCNPENLFLAASDVFPGGRWVGSSYVNAVSPLDASWDQHVAWEFPTLLKATRTIDYVTSAPTQEPAPELAPAPAPAPAPVETSLRTQAIEWLSDSANSRFCTITPLSDGGVFIDVEDSSKKLEAILNSRKMAAVPGKYYDFSVTARRRSGAVITMSLIFRDGSGRIVQSGQLFPKLGNWTTLRVTRKAPANAATAEIALRSGTSSTGVTQIASVSLQER